MGQEYQHDEPWQVSLPEAARTAPGRALQPYELRMQARKAASYLLVGALIQFGVAGLFAGLGWYLEEPGFGVFVLVLGAIASVMLCLYIWARRQPLQATLTALILALALPTFVLLSGGEWLVAKLGVHVLYLIAHASAVSFALGHARASRALREAAPPEAP